MTTQLNIRRFLWSLLKSFVLLFAIVCMAACSISTKINATPTSLPPPTASSTNTPTPVPPTNTPEPTATPAPLTPAKIFEKISPSIAFIETPLAHGSGVLLENGYILTNAHVIWPFQTARIVFSDGTEYEDVPLVHTDMMRDLVILGSIDTELPPLNLEDGEGLVAGSTVYLVGFPGEVEEFPQPTITLGIISRIREWEAQDVTYFQTDAAISGGQSGGALVSEMGNVIGISGFSFANGEFGLVASSADIYLRVENMLAGDDRDALSAWWIDIEKPIENSSHIFHSPWSPTIYYFQEPPETEVEIMIEGEADLGLLFIDTVGNVIDFVDNSRAFGEVLTFTTELDAPYFVLVYSNSTQNIWPSGNVKLHTIDERDEGNMLQPGQSVQSTIDIPWDSDYYRIFLHKDEVIHITVDSSMIDPYITVRQNPDEAEEQWVQDDDSGGGIFGTNAELAYKAPEIGEYFIIIEDATLSGNGGYTLTVTEPTELSPTPMAPLPTAVPIDTEFGVMTSFKDEDLGFGFEYPATMDSGGYRFISEFSDICLEVEYCFSDEQALLAIIVEDLAMFGDMTLEEYGDLYNDSMETMDFFELEDTGYIETHAGSALVFSYNLMDIVKVKRLLLVYEDVGVGMTYMYTNPYPGDASPIPSDDRLRWSMTNREIEEIVDYSFLSLDSVDP